MKAMILLAVIGAVAANAQTGTIGPKAIPGATREQKLFTIQTALKAMDVNDDRKVTADEWTAKGGKRANFDLLDTNLDSILTVQELRSNARKLRAFEDYVAAPDF